MRLLILRFLLAFVALVALTACGRTGDDGDRSTSSLPSDHPPVEQAADPPEFAADEAATPEAEPEPDPAEQAAAAALAANGEPAAVLRHAYVTLSTRLFRAVEPETVLSAAWMAVREEARGQGFSDAALLRRYGDDASKSIDAFVGQFNRLVTGPGSDLDSGRLAQAAIRGMTSAINDSHTRFVPSSAAASRSEDGGYSGIGVVTRQDGNRGLEINEVYQGGPADQAGLRAGDRIVGVNGDDVTNRAQAAISDMIRGPSGTTVQLTLQTVNGETREVTVTRGQITIPVISSRMEGDRIGYLRVASFPRRSRTRDAAAEFESHLAKLEAAGAKAFVLDLRGNPGGDPFTSVNIASNFTQDGPIFVAIDREGKRTVYPANRNRKLVSGPVVVLIDAYSASGAEVVASAIKEYGAGHVMGQRTCGCLSVGQTVRLPDGSEIVVTVQQALTGRYEQSLEGNGLEPDETVRAARVVGGTDNVLARALDHLNGQLP